MKELKTKYNYGVYVYEHEQEIVNIIEEINNNLDESFHKGAWGDVCLDIDDINEDATEADCAIYFSKQTCEDEDDALTALRETLDNIPGVTYTIDSYPDVFEDGYNYSYPVCIKYAN